ncbi:hypothetical protein HYALB_00013968 [Hymenoscyphus albidus]|uniref:Uncharacterized protein n=1 Tax=Hymenoscyphus albidus TaxID=595503 RepID=A0A9N9Q711_9HELO|nr:hypothetical protein HYALB_00013968 [Hymenoscyphus albidus]
MAPNATNTISINPPTRFHPPGPKLVAPPPPPLTWLERTWNVTHSTLPMWKKAKNVRITYKILPRDDGKGCCLEDEVVYDDIDGKPEGCFERWLGMRQIRGVDCEGREGLSAGLYEEIMRKLEDVGELEGCEELGKIVKGMFGVKIDL